MDRNVAVYAGLRSAQAAVDDLIDNGYPREAISLIARDPEGRYAAYLDEPKGGAADGAGIGALLGGLTGAVIGLAAFPIPVVGTAIAAGPVVAALTGGAVGAAGGALTGALVDALVDEYDVPPETAEVFAESIRRGGVVVLVDTAETDTLAAQILQRHDPVDIERTVTGWRERGWTGWDPQAAPYEAYDTDRDFVKR